MANELEQRARFEEWLGRQPTEYEYLTITVEQAGGNSGDDRYLSQSTSLAWNAWQAALQQAQQPGAQAVAIVGDDLYPGWVDDAPDLPPGTKLYAASPPLPLEPEPDLDERDPKSGELVAQWLFRNGFHELAAVVRAQLDMRAPRKAPPPLPEGVSEEDAKAALAAMDAVLVELTGLYGVEKLSDDHQAELLQGIRAALENFRARLAARGEKGVQGG